MNKYATIALIVGIGFAIHSASAEQLPSWIKTNAGLWASGQIGDAEFANGIQYMLQQGIIQVPAQVSSTSGNSTSGIPSWIKTNAGLWTSDKIGNDEFIKGIQYMVSTGIITLKTTQPTNQDSSSAANVDAQSSIDVSSCEKIQSAADKDTCIENIAQAAKLKSEIANSTPHVVGPITYYLVGTDAISTGDGVMITVHTIITNTGSKSQNVDLYCMGPVSCNYHITDGQNDFAPSIYSLTSGHLELIYQVPHQIDWNFYTKSTLFGWTYDSSKQYSFKISEPFGSGLIPLKYQLQ